MLIDTQLSHDASLISTLCLETAILSIPSLFWFPSLYLSEPYLLTWLHTLVCFTYIGICLLTRQPSLGCHPALVGLLRNVCVFLLSSSMKTHFLKLLFSFFSCFLFLVSRYRGYLVSLPGLLLHPALTSSTSSLVYLLFEYYSFYFNVSVAVCMISTRARVSVIRPPVELVQIFTCGFMI